MEPRAGTAIFTGMKWGAALLDPSTQFIADEPVPLLETVLEWAAEEIALNIELKTNDNADCPLTDRVALATAVAAALVSASELAPEVASPRVCAALAFVSFVMIML